jgi:hypothetical protein
VPSVWKVIWRSSGPEAPPLSMTNYDKIDKVIAEAFSTQDLGKLAALHLQLDELIRKEKNATKEVRIQGSSVPEHKY